MGKSVWYSPEPTPVAGFTEVPVFCTEGRASEDALWG